MKNIEVLHEDDLCLVINKPAGLAVQGGEGVKSSLDKILADAYNPPPLLVHRLDKDTSGIILTAKTKVAAAQFSRLLGTSDGSRNSGVKKQYIAVCAGCPAKSEGYIKLDLQIKNSLKKSETRYLVQKSGRLTIPGSPMCEYSVLELELGTGRMHQIRRHLAMSGNPILGDDKYGDFALNKKLRKALGLKRLLLHASCLVIDNLKLHIHSPPPEPFNLFVTRFT